MQLRRCNETTRPSAGLLARPMGAKRFTTHPKLNMMISQLTCRSGRSAVRSQCPAVRGEDRCESEFFGKDADHVADSLISFAPCRFLRPFEASFADPPPTHGACCTLQVELSNSATTGVY